MKNLEPKLIGLFKTGYCTPQIARLARKLKEPSATIHYNIKKLEKEGKIKAYGAVFDYKKIEYGYCVYLLAKLKQDKYDEPEEVARRIAKDEHVESIDICTGDNELILKLRTKNVDEYYEWIKRAVKQYGFSNVISLTSLKQIKAEFIEL